jgi:AAHS family 4-hydroxybenzoate transporter-like MFS transporter
MSTPGANVFDVNRFLDSRNIGRVHVVTVVLLIFTMIVDGYDIFLVGIVLPFLAKDLGVAPAALTIVAVVQQFGLLLGNFVVGPIADRYGRRVTLLTCLTVFGALTLVAPFASTVPEFVVLRFVTGVFLSGVIPNAIALVSELMPTRVRATFVSITFAGFTMGTTVIGAPVVKWLVPYGWEYAFVAGGVLPLLLVAILYFGLPESLRFLAGRAPHDPRIPLQLRRLDSSLALTGNETFVVRGVEAGADKVPILMLFRDGRAATTVLLWIGFHMAFIVSNLMGTWRNQVLTAGGLSLDQIASIMFFPGVAGVIGTLTSGYVMDRLGATRVLPVYLAAASIAMAAIAFLDLPSVWTMIAFVVSGYFSNGGLSGLNALASITYPSQVRATGVSWAHAAGRAGSMVGPALGGALIAAGFGVTGVFLVTAVPQLCAGIAILVMWRLQTPARAADASSRTEAARV